MNELARVKGRGSQKDIRSSPCVWGTEGSPEKDHTGPRKAGPEHPGRLLCGRAWGLPTVKPHSNSGLGGEGNRGTFRGLYIEQPRHWALLYSSPISHAGDRVADCVPPK